MKVIGLTGGFGTGKSTVAGIFKGLGCEVLDADRIAHSVISKGSPAYSKIVRHFGRSILTRSGAIDRKALGRIVFDDSKYLNTLNAIVHPEAVKRIKAAIERSRPDSIVIIDAPLLVEANLARIVDVLIVVKASRKNQVARCSAKFGMAPGDILKRIKSQMPLERKVKMADYIIDNNGTKSETEKQVQKIWRKVWR